MDSVSPAAISALIRQRRAIFPKMYLPNRPIAEEIIREVLENANWAPTHKLTQPWRFRVLQGSALRRLGEFLANHYKEKNPSDQFSEITYNKLLTNPQRAAAVVVLIMQRDPAESLPEWEEIAAVACAVQNMWLTCTAYGIGAYWSTPSAITTADKWLGLEPGQRCLGLFYMGWYDPIDLPGKRTPIEDKTVWINE